MANTLTLKTNYNSSLQTIGATDKILFQKAGAFDADASGAISVTEYNGGMHIVDAADAELCNTAHPANLKYVDDNNVSINGGATALLTSVTTAQCFDIHMECVPNAQVIASSFFVYGDTEADAPTDVTTKGFEQGDAAWVSVGGSAAAKSLGTSPSAAAHDFYFGLSVSPDTNGEKTGTLKCSVTVV